MPPRGPILRVERLEISHIDLTLNLPSDGPVLRTEHLLPSNLFLDRLESPARDGSLRRPFRVGTPRIRDAACSRESSIVRTGFRASRKGSCFRLDASEYLLKDCTQHRGALREDFLTRLDEMLNGEGHPVSPVSSMQVKRSVVIPRSDGRVI